MATAYKEILRHEIPTTPVDSASIHAPPRPEVMSVCYRRSEELATLSKKLAEYDESS